MRKLTRSVAVSGEKAALWVLAVLVWLAACGSDRNGAQSADGQAKADGKAWLEDAAAASGLDFVHFNGMSGAFYFCEIIGSGGALFDYDRDGDLDVYLVQGAMIGQGKTPGDALFPPPSNRPLRDRLFRNDLEVAADGSRRLRFVDVTEESGIDAREYGLGAAVGDIDNDGWPDLYVTNLGRNRLFRNRGDGSFEDVSAAAGVDLPEMSVSASFFDYDRDGWLDLFVGNYVDFEPARNLQCFMGGVLDYCHPTVYGAVPDRLFRNRGDGSFEDVSAAAGLDQVYGRALGVVAADFNADGLQDVYVANDKTANQFWVNRGGGFFEEMALFAGNALNESGMAEASMGVDAGDVDGDGDEDLFMSHYRNETNTFYLNDGAGIFVDQTVLSGLGPASLPHTGFGAAWFDVDNDGWLDVFVANGAVARTEDMAVDASDPYPYHEPNQLFRNRGDGVFDDVSEVAGPAINRSEVSRAAMFGDIDNDGDVDVLVANNSGPARLYLNQIGADRPWLGLELWRPDQKREGLGARVALFRTDGAVLWRRSRTDGSYAGANDPRVHFGLGDGGVEKIRVIWTDGLVEEWRDLAINRWHRLARGSGAKIGDGS